MADLSKPQSGHDLENLVNFNHMTYLLYLLGLISGGMLLIIPIVMNYVRRGEARGTWLESHFVWQIHMFWYTLFWWAVGLCLMAFSGGWFVLAMDEGDYVSDWGAIGMVGMFMAGLGVIGVSWLWDFYRVIRGWVALSRGQSVP